MRESIDSKAQRYLLEHRVTVVRATETVVRAFVRGDETYRVVATRGGWACSCPSVRTCSHVLALQHVAVRPGGVR